MTSSVEMASLCRGIGVSEMFAETTEEDIEVSGSQFQVAFFGLGCHSAIALWRFCIR
jgi:hypothetical protein